MGKAFRKTGIDVIGDAPWGTHLCQFYQTKKDLIDILVPYFKAGLENNEFCMWITSEPLKVEDAKAALKKVVKNLDHFIKKGQIEILDDGEWYTQSGKFDANNVLQGWVEKENQALKRGCDGLRLSVNTFGFAKRDWRNFTDYEEEVNNLIGQYRMIAICTYSLGKCGASEVIDVISNHQFALVRREGEWVIIESSERKRAEVGLRESKEFAENLIASMQDGLSVLDTDGVHIDVNAAFCQMTGLSREELIGVGPPHPYWPPEAYEGVERAFQKTLRGEFSDFELSFMRKNGECFPVFVSPSWTKDKQGNVTSYFATVKDITERKQAEEVLKKSEERFRTSAETLLEGFAILSAVRDSNGQIIDFKYEYINKAGCKMNQKPHEEHMGKTLLELLPTHKEIGLFDEYVRVVETGQSLTKEFLIYETVYGSGERLRQAFDVRITRLGDGLVTTWQDITDKKKGEELLRRSEERLRLLIENSKDVIIMADLEGSITYYNGPPEYGITAEEALGKNPFSIFEPAIAASLMNQLKLVIKGGEALTFENNIPGRGESFWFLNQMYPIRNEKGRMIAVGLIARDITERKRAEKALRESEATARALMDSPVDSILVVNPDGIILDTNQTFAQRIGRRVDELIGRCVYDFFPPELVKSRRARVDEIVHFGVSIRFEDECAGIQLDHSAHPICDAQGKVTKIAIVARDITERKQREEEYRTILRTATDGFWIVDMEGRFLDVNDAYCHLVGYGREELLTMRVQDVEAVERPEETAQRIQKIMKTGGDRFETRHRRKDGRILDIEVSANYLEVGDGRFFVFLRNITERKRAEEALRESEATARALMDSPVDSILVVNPDGIILDTNQTFAQRIGRRVDELIGRCVYDFFPPELVKSRRARVDEIVHFGVPIRFEDERAGIQLDHSAHPICGAQGKVTKIAIVARDITARKQAEEALRESEEKYRNLVESVRDVVYTIDSSGVFTYISPVAKNTLGYEPDELIGRQFLGVVHKEDHDLLMRRFSELREGIVGSYTRDSDYRVIGKHGDIKWVRTLTNPIIEEGGFVGARGVLIDITERKRAEQALRESEEKYRILVENANEAIVVAQDGTLKFVNPKTMDILGYSKEELTSKPFTHFIHPDDREMVLKNHLKRLGGETLPDVYSFRIVDKGSNTKWLDISAVLITWEGRPATMNFLSDITERKQAEEALKESERRYRSLFDGIPIGLYRSTPTGQVVDANPALAQMFGYPDRESFLAIEAADTYVNPEVRILWQNLIERDGVVSNFENQMRRRDGTTIWVEENARVVRDAEGGVLYYEGSMTDITERKRVEEALRRAEENFRHSLDESPLGIRIVSTNGETLYVNRAILDIYGYDSIEELRTTPVKERWSPESYAGFQIRKEKRQRGEDDPSEYEISIVRKNGEVRHLQVLRKEVLWNGEKQYQVIYRDISKRKQVEEALRRKSGEQALLLNNIQTQIWYLTDGETYGAVNKARAEFFGKKNEEMENKKLFDVLSKSEAEICMSGYVEVFEKRKRTYTEEWIANAKGEKRLLSIIKSPKLNENGDIEYVVCSAEDITERKQAEKELREREQEIRVIAENVPALFSYIDMDGRYRFVNKRYEEWFGIHRTEIIGKHCKEVLGEAAYDLIKGHMEAALSGHRVHYEKAIPYTFGGTRWVSADYVPDADDRGKVKGFFALVTDITERKWAEEALQASKELFEKTFISQRDAIFLLDAINPPTILDCNPAATEVFGYTREEMVGRTTDFLHVNETKLREFQQHLHSSIAEHGFMHLFEFRMRRKDGTVFPTEHSMTSLEDIQGKRIGWVSVVRDITEAKQAEEELLEREMFNFALFEYNPIQTIVVDLEGKVTGFNLSKKKSGDRLPNIEDVMYKDYAGKYENDMYGELMKCIRSGEIKEFPEQKYGENVLSVTISPFHKGAVIISQDITERKQAEERVLTYQEQLRSLTSELSLIEERERHHIATELHDNISQTLAITKIKLGMAQEVASSTDWVGSLNEIGELIDQAIQYTRSLTFELSPPILYELGLEAGIEWLTEQIQEKHGIQIGFEDDQQPKPMNEEIRFTLFKATRELLINIVKHAQASKAKVSIWREDHSVRIRVEDDGVGFSTSEGKQLRKASGFGLFNIRERIKYFGGDMVIESEPGRGTRVTLVAPLEEKKD